jgi:hypothetical protein
MRFLASIFAVFLFFLLAASVPAFSQEPSDRPAQTQDDKAKNKDDKAVKQDDRGMKQEEGKEGKQDEARPDERKTAPPHSGTAQQEETPRPDRRQEDHADRDHEGRPASAQQHGQRIPEDKFRAHFGREHHFHVERARVVNQSQPVVMYEGYSFEMVDPWPADWSYDDDCYIDYVDNDYYLFDVAHPGIRIAVIVLG